MSADALRTNQEVKDETPRIREVGMRKSFLTDLAPSLAATRV
jgi:hypothetical protein